MVSAAVLQHALHCLAESLVAVYQDPNGKEGPHGRLLADSWSDAAGRSIGAQETADYRRSAAFFVAEVKRLRERDQLERSLCVLWNEKWLFEKLMYKNKNQHNRSPHWHRLNKVKKHLRKLQSLNFLTFLAAIENGLGPTLKDAKNNNKGRRLPTCQELDCTLYWLLGYATLTQSVITAIIEASPFVPLFHVAAYFMLYYFMLLLSCSLSLSLSLSELNPWCLVASFSHHTFHLYLRNNRYLLGLLQQTYFMSFAVTVLSCLARIHTLLQETLLTAHSLLYNLLFRCKAYLPPSSASSSQQSSKTFMALTQPFHNILGPLPGTLEQHLKATNDEQIQRTNNEEKSQETEATTATKHKRKLPDDQSSSDFASVAASTPLTDDTQPKKKTKKFRSDAEETPSFLSSTVPSLAFFDSPPPPPSSSSSSSSVVATTPSSSATSTVSITAPKTKPRTNNNKPNARSKKGIDDIFASLVPSFSKPTPAPPPKTVPIASLAPLNSNNTANGKNKKKKKTKQKASIAK
ncbi:hypothetical protein QOT17_020108 [Balamuthia mandrillaris]